MKSKTLIIHPEDSSTDFLKVIYKEIFNCKVISGGNISKLKLQSEIKNAENIILIGHGDAFGLFGNNNTKYIIDSSFCEFLKSKNCLLIWCHANQFISKNKLNFNGIYTAMFISESKPSEMIFLNSQFETEDIEILKAYQPMVNESNNAFSSILGNLLKKYSFDDLPLIYEKLKLKYEVIAERNEVAAYNNEHLFLSLVK